MTSLTIKSLSIGTLALVTLLTIGAQAAPSKTGTATCAGRALDGTQIEVKFCFKVPATRGDGVVRKACDGTAGSIQTTINGATEDYGAVSTLTIFENMYVGLKTINDGRETHSAIEFSSQEYDRAWNTMKITSVKTGTKYLVIDFTCTVVK